MKIYEEENNNIKIEMLEKDNVCFSVLEVYLHDKYLFYSKIIEDESCVVLENVSKGKYLLEIKQYNFNGDLVNFYSHNIVLNKEVIKEIDDLFPSLLKISRISFLIDLLERKPLSLNYLFMKLRTVLHGSGFQFNKKFFLDSCSFILFNSNLNTSQGLFLLSLIIYAYDKHQLNHLYSELDGYVSSLNIPIYDKYYLRGLLNYKVGNFYQAESYFSNLEGYEEYLLSHQLIALTYQNNFYIRKSDDNKLKIYQLLNIGKGKEGVVLISCDLGYYNVYRELIEEQLLDQGVILHYHLIVPEGFNIDLIQGHENIGISYEIEDIDTRQKNRHHKTYYSVVRYLIAEEISRMYDKPVLISDIDIDYSDTKVDKLFGSIADYEAALVFSKLDLPWTQILAGFNLFGKNFFSTDFYKIVCEFILLNLSRSKDYWMLDQVSLSVAYANSTKETISKIRSMSMLSKKSVRQQKNNSILKYEARKSILEEINNIIRL